MEHGPPRLPRVCILAETFAPEVGGGETQALLLARTLLENGCEVLVITRRSGRELPRAERIAGVPVRRMGPVGRGQLKKWGLVVTAVPTLIRFRSHYDVVLACPFRILGLPAALVSQALAKPCILKAETNGELSGAFFGPGLRRWGLSPRSWTVRALLRVRNWGLRRATAFVALSSTIAAELRGHGVAPEAIHVIPNGVDTARFVPATGEERARLRRSLGMAPDDVIFLYTGRLVSYKGLPLLVSVWRNVTERHARLRLVLVGSGGADLHNCEADLRRYVTDHGLAGAVRFAGEVADVVPYLQAADAFVFPTEEEAFGMALIEAMACGLPVITTRVGGIADIVTPDSDALVVPAGDGAALDAAVGRLLDDRELALRLGATARRTAVSRFSQEIVAAAYFELVRRVTTPQAEA